MAAPRLTAEQFKRELAFRAARLEAVADVLPDGEPVVVTVKVDGELEVFDVDVPADVALLTNRNERERWAIAIRDELLAAARRAGYQSVRGAGELYAVDAQGRPLPFSEVISLIKRRTKGESRPQGQQALRFAVFDVFSVDGQQLWGTVPYAERFALAYTLFAGGALVHPVAGQVDVREPAPIQALWKKHVLEGNFEGLVLRVNGAVKIKPIHTVDVAVIGIVPGKGKHRGRMGALVTAFRDRAGRYLAAGKVGTGFTDAERQWWHRHVRRVTGKAHYGRTAWEREVTFVVPDHVIEVEAVRFTRPTVKAWSFDGTQWTADPPQPGAVAQHPRFVRRRPDKTIAPHDVRLTQVPGWRSAATDRLIPTPTGDGQVFANLIASLRDDLFRVSQKLGVDPSDFDDVYQDTVVKAMQMWQRLEAAWPTVPPGAPEPGKKALNWLTTILYRKWLDAERKQARRRKKLEQLDLFAPARARRARANPKRRRRRQQVHP